MSCKELDPKEARRWRRVGKLAALGILLSYVEAFVPIPIPGVKLGLANVAVLLALAQHDTAGALCIALIKVLASGLLFGSPLTIAYSTCGTLLSLVGMIPLSRLRTMRIWMVSIVGAVLHETGQLAVASVLLGTSVVWYLAPILAIAGCITGLLCGLIAQQFENALASSERATYSGTEARKDPLERPVPPPPSTLVLLGALAVYTIVLLHVSDLRLACACTAVAFLACLVSPATYKELWRGMRPLVPLLCCTAVLQFMLNPQTAPRESALACARLLGIAAAGTAFMSFVPTQNLTAAASWVVLPLNRLGIDTRGFLLAFDVAVTLVPTLISKVEARPHRLRDLPDVVIDAYAQL